MAGPGKRITSSLGILLGAITATALLCGGVLLVMSPGRVARTTVTALEVPTYFFSGAYDYTVNHDMSEQYLRQLDAPVKGFYLFTESAHSPIFEEPDKVARIIKDDVFNGTNALADAS
ncbi:hypothetical protein GA0111570_10283 [Raineyella antarctica]|uniref:Alpha/beta hydrolase family protein n=1 Tax=Raineyella antarctica TaxID=1577474 RepID=A0A1G6GEA0_9ACTN|nr:alpha/beta hydrolase [Raineyella antarctica]SDB80297.1 hypothetical protein GA0111570_10283 [Raineyella antarctica]